MRRVIKGSPDILTLTNIRTVRDHFSLAIDALRLRAGEIACVVGANGSGKTTLLLTLLGLLPHDGDCRIKGELYDGQQVLLKAAIGFIPDNPDLLFEELTAKEQWTVTASVLASLQLGKAEALLKKADLIAQALSFDPPPILARDYSHGMRKKTQIVNAILGGPSVLVVDELRNGLDPIAIKESETLIQQEKSRGAAIIVATHDLWWAERFADYIYVLHKGKLIAEGPVTELLQGTEKNLEAAFFRIIGEKL